MNVPEICKSISLNLSEHRRLAKTDVEYQSYISEALLDYDAQVIPPLNRLLDDEGEGGQNLKLARTAALDLVSVVCNEFFSKCTNYRWGVVTLVRIYENCRDPELKRKLLLLTNQLKKKWNDVEPFNEISSLHIGRNPRKLPEKKSYESLLLIPVVIGVIIFIFIKLAPTTPDIPKSSKSVPTISRVQENRPEDVPQPYQVTRVLPVPEPSPSLPPSSLSQPSLPSQPSPPLNTPGSFYTFTDKQGVYHMVDDLGNVPQEYRVTMKEQRIGTSNGGVTPVIIRENLVIVPVRLTFRGRNVEAMLLLDTGATITTINTRVAIQLGIEGKDTRPGQSIVADGRSIGSYECAVDLLSVGPRTLSQPHLSIIPGVGGVGYDGLLGMNFLKKFRYHIDFNRSVIQWGG